MWQSFKAWSVCGFKDHAAFVFSSRMGTAGLDLSVADIIIKIIILCTRIYFMSHEMMLFILFYNIILMYILCCSFCKITERYWYFHIWQITVAVLNDDRWLRKSLRCCVVFVSSFIFFFLIWVISFSGLCCVPVNR